MFNDDRNVTEIRRVLEEIDREAEIEDEEKAEKQIKYRFTRLSDEPLLSPAKYLIKGYLYLDQLIVVFGDAETCKSLLMLEKALCASNGMKWRGHRTKECQVFYIAGEGRNGIRCRVKAWRQETGGHDDNFWLIDKAASLIDCEHAIAVREAIKALRDDNLPCLIIVDTLARNFGPGDENSTQDMTLFVANVDQYLRVPFAAATVLIHHSGVADKTRGRGSSVLRGAADIEFSLQKSNGTSTLSCTKMKDFDRPPNMDFTVKGVEISGLVDEDGEAVTAPVLAEICAPAHAPETKTQADVATLNRLFERLYGRQKENLVLSGHAKEPSVLLADLRDDFYASFSGTVKHETLKKKFQRALKNPDICFEIKGLYCCYR